MIHPSAKLAEVPGLMPSVRFWTGVGGMESTSIQKFVHVL